MKFKVLIAAILFGLSLPAAAEYKVIQEAHEVRLSDLRLPQNETGTVGFKPCDDCSYLIKRVDENTEWILDGQKLSLQTFKRNLRGISDRENTPVTVLHHLEDDQVTRVTVSPVRTVE